MIKLHFDSTLTSLNKHMAESHTQPNTSSQSFKSKNQNKYKAKHLWPKLGKQANQNQSIYKALTMAES